MPGPSKIPTFNLKVVLNETGLKPDTIRAWERRYGLPHPDRSEGGHRLYSEYDIRVFKWLIARQDEGMSISRAAGLWHRFVAQGDDPFGILNSSLKPQASSSSQAAHPVELVIEKRESWLEACYSFNESQAEQVLNEAFTLYSPETVCFEILVRGLEQVGDAWFRGEVTVQQEHFASALAARRLHTLTTATSAPTRDGRILVACPSGEEHTFGSLLIVYLLRRQGWDTIYLGASVPLDHMKLAIEATHPGLAILSAQRLPSAATLAEMANVFWQQHIPTAYGGWIFNKIPALADHIRGVFLAANLQDVTANVEACLRNPFVPHTARHASHFYQVAHANFVEYEPQIIRDLRIAAADMGIGDDHLNAANYHLGQNIAAVLKLGDITLLLPDIDWVKQLLANRSLPVHLLDAYLDAYGEAAKRYLRADHPVNSWFRDIAKQ